MKTNDSFSQRKEESMEIRHKYPNKVPIICKKYENSKLNDIDRNNFLMPNDFTIRHFILYIRKRIQLKPEQALYLFTSKNKFPHTNQNLEELYNRDKEQDGFLYIYYKEENTFG